MLPTIILPSLWEAGREDTELSSRIHTGVRMGILDLQVPLPHIPESCFPKIFKILFKIFLGNVISTFFSLFFSGKWVHVDTPVANTSPKLPSYLPRDFRQIWEDLEPQGQSLYSCSFWKPTAEQRPSGYHLQRGRTLFTLCPTSQTRLHVYIHVTFRYKYTFRDRLTSTCTGSAISCFFLPL